MSVATYDRSTALKCGIALAATVLVVRFFRTALDYTFGRQEQVSWFPF